MQISEYVTIVQKETEETSPKELDKPIFAEMCENGLFERVK